MKDESSYRKDVLPKVYNEVRKKIKDDLHECEWISFTSDIWTADTTKDSFISLTSNGITKYWYRKKHVLAIRKFGGSHTAERIAEILEELFNEWELDEKKCHGFLSDSAANIKKGISLVRFWHENQQNTEDDEMMAGMLGGSCASHDLNLCVKQSFGKRKEDAVQCILEKCRRIIGHFKHSALANEELNLIQKEFCMDEHKLLQDVSTRWNSTLISLRRFIEQRQAIDQLMITKKQYNLLLDDREWEILNLVKVIQNF